MKKELSKDFQTQLWAAVKALEQVSQAEVVVVLRASSQAYSAIPLLWGIGAAWLSHTYLIFAPELYEDELVYGLPILGFAMGYAFALLPLVKRLCSKKTVLQKNVEIMARAIFQKGGLHHTRAKTGLLVYVSFLERSVFLLPDRGLEMAMPDEEWQGLREQFNRIFASKKPLAALLLELNKTEALFARYLPALADDINELPDDMEIDL
ncbi:MAG: hypothetical protein NTV43_13160 [Methylococcales bacterium]|nr:hypothetical protein [Methylococcales bacterium]